MNGRLFAVHFHRKGRWQDVESIGCLLSRQCGCRLAFPMQPTVPASQPQKAEMPICVPIAQRVREVGCWIIVRHD